MVHFCQNQVRGLDEQTRALRVGQIPDCDRHNDCQRFNEECCECVTDGHQTGLRSLNCEQWPCVDLL